MSELIKGKRYVIDGLGHTAEFVKIDDNFGAIVKDIIPVKHLYSQGVGELDGLYPFSEWVNFKEVEPCAD